MVTALGAFFATGGFAASAKRPKATNRERRSARCLFTRESLARERAVRKEGLRGATLAAEEVDRIAPCPGVGRVAHGAEGLVLLEGALAVIAGDGSAERYILLATH